MFILKAISGVIVQLVIFGALLFIPAGTLHWWRAWVFLGVIFVCAAAMMVFVFPAREELFDQRLRFPIQKGQPLADKIILPLVIATFGGLLVFIPLDVFRFHLMGRPAALVSSLGLILFVAGWSIMSLVLWENPFAVSVVRIQPERHQTVIDTGLYGVVRHPMYAGAVLLLVGMPLWLESYAATLLASVPIAVLVARTLIEENLLKRELQGYEAYMRRVRYRLIPYVW